MLVNMEGAVGPAARGWLDLAAIDRPVTDLPPHYAALIIVAEGLQPGPSDQAPEALLSEAEVSARAALVGRVASELEPVAAWRDAYQAFRAKPKRTTCSFGAS